MRVPGLALIFAAGILFAQNPTPASVQGVAIIAGSDEPVSGAVIELRPAGGGAAEPIFAATQSNGSFLLRSVPPGRYSVVATRNGYLSAELGQRSPSGRGTPIVVTPGLQVTGLRMGMTPTAAISGRILDSAGQAMPGVAVQVLQPSFRDGRRTLSVMKSMLTNDLGEYRIFWVPPGSYYVNVVPPADTPPGNGISLVINPFGQPSGRSLWWNPGNVTRSPVGNGLLETEAYLPVFFPGTPDESAATLVDLAPGADVRGIDIRVAPFRAWRIRGVVSNATSRQPMAGINLQLISLGPDARVVQTTSDAMGRYAIPKVPSGRYVLGGLAPPAGVGRLTFVEVRDSDIEANVELQPLHTLSGRVRAPNPTALTVRLRVDLGIPNPPQLNATPSADGSFTIRNVLLTDYRVFVSPILQPQAPAPPAIPGNLQNTYVKSIQFGDTELLDSTLHLDRPPEAQIEIVVATDPGSLTGRVLDSRQMPVPAATVVLLPEIERRPLRTDLYRTAITDEAGQFLMEGVPPGNYRVFCWESVADFAWQDPAFMRTQEERGRAVRITESARETLDLSPL